MLLWKVLFLLSLTCWWISSLKVSIRRTPAVVLLFFGHWLLKKTIGKLGRVSFPKDFRDCYWEQGKNWPISLFEVARETWSRWFQKAFWDCFGERIFNMAANSFPKTVPQCTLTTISTRSPAQPQRGTFRLQSFLFLKWQIVFYFLLTLSPSPSGVFPREIWLYFRCSSRLLVSISYY